MRQRSLGDALKTEGPRPWKKSPKRWHQSVLQLYNDLCNGGFVVTPAVDFAYRIADWCSKRPDPALEVRAIESTLLLTSSLLDVCKYIVAVDRSIWESSRSYPSKRLDDAMLAGHLGIGD